MLIFVVGGKPENQEKSPRSKEDNQQQTQTTYDVNPGHTGGRRLLSPLRHTCSPRVLCGGGGGEGKRSYHGYNLPVNMSLPYAGDILPILGRMIV